MQKFFLPLSTNEQEVVLTDSTPIVPSSFEQLPTAALDRKRRILVADPGPKNRDIKSKLLGFCVTNGFVPVFYTRESEVKKGDLFVDYTFSECCINFICIKYKSKKRGLSYDIWSSKYSALIELICCCLCCCCWSCYWV